MPMGKVGRWEGKVEIDLGRLGGGHDRLEGMIGEHWMRVMVGSVDGMISMVVVLRTSFDSYARRRASRGFES